MAGRRPCLGRNFMEDLKQDLAALVQKIDLVVERL